MVEGYLEKKKTSAISEKETDFLRVDREEPFPVSLDERPDTEKHSESDFIRQTQVETDLSEADEIAVEMQDHTGKIQRINAHIQKSSTCQLRLFETLHTLMR